MTSILSTMALNTSSNGVPYTLYYHRFSICSLMMRWLVDVRGEPKDEASRMDISTKEINIFNEEQFSESYLCDVNPNGQVFLHPFTARIKGYVGINPDTRFRF